MGKYRLGHYTLPRARDYVGQLVELHSAHHTRGGQVFSPGEPLEIRRVFGGKADLKRVSDGARIRGVQGYEFSYSTATQKDPT